MSGLLDTNIRGSCADLSPRKARTRRHYGRKHPHRATRRRWVRVSPPVRLTADAYRARQNVNGGEGKLQPGTRGSMHKLRTRWAEIIAKARKGELGMSTFNASTLASKGAEGISYNSNKLYYRSVHIPSVAWLNSEKPTCESGCLYPRGVQHGLEWSAGWSEKEWRSARGRVGLSLVGWRREVLRWSASAHH